MKDLIDIAVKHILWKSLNPSQGKMLIACTTVAHDTAIRSQFRKNPKIKLKGSADYQELPSKAPYISKGPKI